MYSLLVIIYLFLGGASAGCLSVTALVGIMSPYLRISTNHRWRGAFHKLALRSYLICAVMLVFSIFCLLWDLGRPERALLLLILPHPTLLTLGVWVLLIELGTSLVLLLTASCSCSRLAHMLRRVFEVVCVACSLLVMVYTGLFLAQTNVPLWNTWLLPMLFVVSSMSTGVALFNILACFVSGARDLLSLSRFAHSVHAFFLLAEAVVLAVYVFAVQTNPAAAPAIAQFLQPTMFAWGVVGVCIIGIAAPLAIDIIVLVRHRQTSFPIGSIMCLMGGFILRYCVVSCATPWMTTAGL